VHTVGLGGDSHVRVDASRRLLVGPQRVIPLSLLASEHPEVVEDLRAQTVVAPRDEVMAQFLVARRRPARPLEDEEAALMQRLARGPASLASIVREARFGALLLRRIERLVAERLVLRAGFTPTDALHALGQLDLWHGEAANLGAQILAAQARRPVADFCHQVVESVSHRAAAALVSKVLSDEAHLPRWDREPTASLLLARALGDGGGGELGLACDLTLRDPLVAIGAPVEAYMPRVAQRLHTDLIIPPHAEVANAVGAVAGGVVQRQRVLITPLEPGTAGGFAVRLHLPDGVRDFHEVETAVAYAQKRMEAWMDDLARQVGGAQVEVQMARQDRSVLVKAGWGDRLYLGSELIFTAVGRPSPALEAGVPDGR
jgi:N-methylhydantoinase A/oxoprolinase/acetone carboxylase beta subunit